MTFPKEPFTEDWCLQAAKLEAEAGDPRMTVGVPKTLYIHVGLVFEGGLVGPFRITKIDNDIVTAENQDAYEANCLLTDVAPWATRFVRVDGGWMGYECPDEFNAIEAST